MDSINFPASLRLSLALAALICPAGAVELIQLNFSGTMTARQQQTFIDAAAYWNSTITGYDFIHDSQGKVTPHSLVITARVQEIDGNNGVLGSAGPEYLTYYDNNPLGAPTAALYYASTGLMEFDAADVTALETNNSFYSVVLHEMAHVLGIGTLWTYNNNVNGTSYQLYTNGSGQYTGPNALSGWQTEFSQSLANYVPVELGGNPGTTNMHWNEPDYGYNSGIISSLTGMDLSHELMTGWSNDTYFISTMTLGALDDLGYTVDYSKAGVITYVPEPAACLLALAAAPLLGRRKRP